MKLLDLFCGGGGAGAGYALAGFEVTGVDWKPQPAYPFKFHQGDALEFLREHGAEFDVIHASPPCQGYSRAVTHTDSRWVGYSRGKAEPQLIEPLREMLDALGKPYVLENVEGARGHMNAPIVLCGAMFDSHPRRHRLFETNWGLLQPGHPRCGGRDKAFAETHGIDYRDMSVTGKSRRTGSIDVWKQLMGMDWPGLRASDLAEAIPPRYTEYVGRQLMRYLQDSTYVSSTLATRLDVERLSLAASRSSAAHSSGSRRMVRDWRLDIGETLDGRDAGATSFATLVKVDGIVPSVQVETDDVARIDESVVGFEDFNHAASAVCSDHLADSELARAVQAGPQLNNVSDLNLMFAVNLHCHFSTSTVDLVWLLDVEANPGRFHHEGGLPVFDFRVEGVVARVDGQRRATEEVDAPASVGSRFHRGEFHRSDAVVAVADDEFVSHFATSLVDTSMIPTWCDGSQLFSRAKVRQRKGT